MTPRSRIPKPTVKRLCLYLREMESRAEQNQATISSAQLGKALGLTAAQVRKDLAYFGAFGHPGVGYSVAELVEELRKILGTDRSWNACVVGAGNIGRAVMAYQQFRRKGFEIVAVFDADKDVIAKVIAGHHVRPLGDLNQLVAERDIKLGIVAVPKESAQEVANRLVDAGVIGLLNFAPIRLDVNESISVVSVDFSISLEQLAFQVSLANLTESAPGG